MSSHSLDPATHRRLVALWQETGAILARIHADELAAQTPEQSRRAAFDMLQLGGMLPPDPRRARHSGLIEMQRRFALRRARGTA
jgi:hypothetical protein